MSSTKTNPNRGVVTELELTIRYPDGTTKTQTFLNPNDDLWGVLFDEQQAQRWADAGIIPAQVVSKWVHEKQWREKPTALFIGKPEPAAGKEKAPAVADVTQQVPRVCPQCCCPYCAVGPIPWHETAR
jgi:hypothetical protein